jgi:2-beta-glucuronyltransferase
MDRIVLVSHHYFNTKSKAGFHWLADAYWKMGWEVLFITAPISWISWLCKDPRFEYPIFKEANKLIKINEHMWSYILLTYWHPTNIKRINVFNTLATPLYKKYGNLKLGIVEDFIRDSKLIIFESTEAILLFDRFKNINNKARYIYRVSDDMRLHSLHPLAIRTEERISPHFDLISAPSEYIYRIFARFPNAILQYHGIRKDLFDKEYKNPYSNGVNIVFVGNSLFDHDFIRHAAKQFPNWKFHIIGPISGITMNNNIFIYGVMAFEETIPYIIYADIGLQTRLYLPGSQSLTDSLKVIQYTYCKLPIVAPEFLKTNRSHIFYYKPGDPNSIKQALNNALLFDRSKIITNNIYSWNELAMQLLGNVQEND